MQLLSLFTVEVKGGVSADCRVSLLIIRDVSDGVTQ